MFPRLLHTGTCQVKHFGKALIRKDEIIDLSVFPAHVEGKVGAPDGSPVRAAA